MDDKSEPTLFDKIKGVLKKIQEVSARIQDLEVERECLIEDLTTLLEASPLNKRELQQDTLQQELKEEEIVDLPESVVTETNNVVGAMKTCYPQKKTFETERSSCESTDSCLGFEVQPITAGSTVVSSSNLEDKGSLNRSVGVQDVDCDSLRKGYSSAWDERTNSENVVPTKMDLCASSQESSEESQSTS